MFTHFVTQFVMKKKFDHSIFYILLPVLFLFAFSGCKTAEENNNPFKNLESNIKTLSSDAFEGRAPATPGGRKTVAFIESEFERIGLKPAVNGSYRQAVSLYEITGSEFSDLKITRNNNVLQSLKYLDDMVVTSGRTTEVINIANSELVFVGYGIHAPEYNWNDYRDLDVKGKTVVILVNDPGFATQDSTLFEGNTMTYYGRWTYKYEEAARQGAEAAIIIHETEPASYGWEVVRNSWSGPQYRVAKNGAVFLKAESWIQLDAARVLFENAGTTLDKAMEEARTPGFKATSLNQNVSVSFNNNSEQMDCFNVAGYLEGSKYPDETIIYTAHWDHLGKTEKDGRVIIYNGAIDNATGVAGMIALAERFTEMNIQPERSLVFLAVTAEESGLIGSQHYAENPLFPIAKTVAGINMDGLNVYGPTNDIIAVGMGYSELDEFLERHAEKQGRVVLPNPYPERGYYFRSDHFNLAKKGIPAVYASGGKDFTGKDEAYANMVEEDKNSRYHQPSDTIHDLWNYEGIYQDLELYFNIGNELANTDDFPGWKKESAFKETRKQSAAERKR
jgi:Zn-dependent M28 family amino/carboxypeptidase